MKKIIIKCIRENVVWNFINLDDKEYYKERVEEVIENAKKDYDYYSSYSRVGRESLSYWEEILKRRNMLVTYYNTGLLILEEREKGTEEVAGVGTHVFVKTLDTFCLVDKVELDLEGNIIYYISYIKTLDEKENNNLSVAFEEWMSTLYPEVDNFEQMKKYEGVKHEPHEEYLDLFNRYKEATESKSFYEQKKSVISYNSVSNGKTYSDVLRERESQSENNILAMLISGVFVSLFIILLMLGIGS